MQEAIDRQLEELVGEEYSGNLISFGKEMSKQKLYKVNKEKLLELHSSGASQREIANTFNCTEPSIRYWFARLGLKPVGKPGRKRKTATYEELLNIKRNCYSCNQEKFIISFRKNKEKSLGYDYICESCYRRKHKQKAAERNLREKQIVIKHYTHGINRCQNSDCKVPNGMDDLRTLTVDHINGGGAIHRRQILKSQSNSHFYRWLIKNNFPEGFRILCMNCQWVKRYEKKEFASKISNT